MEKINLHKKCIRHGAQPRDQETEAASIQHPCPMELVSQLAIEAANAMRAPLERADGQRGWLEWSEGEEGQLSMGLAGMVPLGRCMQHATVSESFIDAIPSGLTRSGSVRFGTFQCDAGQLNQAVS